MVAVFLYIKHETWLHKSLCSLYQLFRQKDKVYALEKMCTQNVNKVFTYNNAKPQQRFNYISIEIF